MTNPFIPTWRILWWPEAGDHIDKIVESPNIHLVNREYSDRDGHGSVLPTKESCEFFDANPGEKEKAYAPLVLYPYPEYQTDLKSLKMAVEGYSLHPDTVARVLLHLLEKS